MHASEITEKIVDEMFVLHGQFMSQLEIANHFGLTKSAVQRYMANRVKGAEISSKDTNIYEMDYQMKATDSAKFTNEQMSKIFEAVASGVSVQHLAEIHGITFEAMRKRIDIAKRKGFSAKDQAGTHEIMMLRRQNQELSRRLLAETIKSATTREILGRRPDLAAKLMPFLDEVDAFWIKSDQMSINAWIIKLDDIGKPKVSRFHPVSKMA
jgi:predicted transcriptional regulator